METIKIVAVCLASFSLGYNICNFLWEISKSISRKNVKRITKSKINIDKKDNDETRGI